MPFGHARWLIATSLLLLLLGSESLSADKKKLESAVSAVEANMKTPAGKQYDQKIATDFPEKYLPGLKACKQGLPAGAKIDSFDLFIKIKMNGQVADALVYPESQFADCARNNLLNGKLSAPPHDDYWVNVHMQMKH
jgi:uncharacterized protein (DUF3820 family)